MPFRRLRPSFRCEPHCERNLPGFIIGFYSIDYSIIASVEFFSCPLEPRRPFFCFSRQRARPKRHMLVYFLRRRREKKERFIQLTFIRLPFGIIMHPRVNPVQRNFKREIINAARHAIVFDLWSSLSIFFLFFFFILLPLLLLQFPYLRTIRKLLGAERKLTFRINCNLCKFHDARERAMSTADKYLARDRFRFSFDFGLNSGRIADTELRRLKCPALWQSRVRQFPVNHCSVICVSLNCERYDRFDVNNSTTKKGESFWT